MMIVNKIILKPMFGMPIKSKTLKMAFIITPRTLEIGPIMKPSALVNKIPCIKPPYLYLTVQDHIPHLKKDCIEEFSKLPVVLLLRHHIFEWLLIHTGNM
jgi:hypothetical protein